MAFAMSPYLAISDVVFSGHHLSEGLCRMYHAEKRTVNTHTHTEQRNGWQEVLKEGWLHRVM